MTEELETFSKEEASTDNFSPWTEDSGRKLSRTMNDRAERRPWSHLISPHEVIPYHRASQSSVQSDSGRGGLGEAGGGEGRRDSSTFSLGRQCLIPTDLSLQ